MPLGIGWSITIFFSTALLTWAWIRVARRYRIHDQPERRRLHFSDVPRAGGISIGLVMLSASLFLVFRSPGSNHFLPLPVFGLFLYLALGFWDDLKPMSSGKKLFLHLLVAGILCCAAAFQLHTGFAVAIITASAYLLFVNIWNFMDGSNGLVTMQSLACTIGFIALGYFSDTTYSYALALAVCCLGFLPFNFPLARVFLGDVGSHVLGAALVGLAFLAYAEGQWTLLEMLCLTSALWVDAVMTFVRRGIRGYKLAQAHRSHLYQYAIRNGQSHAMVCLYYTSWTAGMVLMIGLSRQLPDITQSVLLLSLIVVACVLHQWLRLFVLKSARYQKKPKFISQ